MKPANKKMACLAGILAIILLTSFLFLGRPLCFVTFPAGTPQALVEAVYFGLCGAGKEDTLSKEGNRARTYTMTWEGNCTTSGPTIVFDQSSKVKEYVFRNTIADMDCGYELRH